MPPPFGHLSAPRRLCCRHRLPASSSPPFRCLPAPLQLRLRLRLRCWRRARRAALCCLGDTSAVSVTCLPCCLPASSLPPLSASPACLVPPSAVDVTCLPRGPLRYWRHLPAPRPLFSVTCLPRGPLRCWRHLPASSTLPSVACLPRRPLRCQRHLPDSLPPPFGNLYALSPPPLSKPPAALSCLVAPSFRYHACLVTTSAVSVTRGPLPPRCPLRCRRHPRPSPASSPPPFCHLRQASYVVCRRASLGRRRPFRSRQSVGGATRWSTNRNVCAPFFDL